MKKTKKIVLPIQAFLRDGSLFAPDINLVEEMSSGWSREEDNFFVLSDFIRKYCEKELKPEDTMLGSAGVVRGSLKWSSDFEIQTTSAGEAIKEFERIYRQAGEDRWSYKTFSHVKMAAVILLNVSAVSVSLQQIKEKYSAVLFSTEQEDIKIANAIVGAENAISNTYRVFAALKEISYSEQIAEMTFDFNNKIVNMTYATVALSAAAVIVAIISLFFSLPK